MASDQVEDHDMHSERYRVPDATMAACEAAERVVAIGTTTVRALESAAETGRLEGRTDLFIHGERPFAMVDALLTNFHLPRRSEEHTSELQSLMRISYAVFCLKKN